jgi:hypothetical protein
MRILNFYPYYEEYLSSGRKTTTFRIHAPGFERGDIAQLTLGWNEEVIRPLHNIEIISVYSKPIWRVPPRSSKPRRIGKNKLKNPGE